MMKILSRIVSVAAMALMVPDTVSAQDENDMEAYFDADIVSHYMWRGQDKGSFSLQPTAYVSWQGLTLRAESSMGFRREDATDLDITLGYENSGFNVGIIDYWTSGYDPFNRYFHYSKNGAHQLEANIGYSWKYGSLQAYTIFWGNDFKVSGKQAYSTYIELGVPFTWQGIDWNAAVGITPFESAGDVVTATTKDTKETKTTADYYYADSFACVMASIRATKTLDLGFAHMPIFAEFHANPYLQTANIVFGVTVCPF